MIAAFTRFAHFGAVFTRIPMPTIHMGWVKSPHYDEWTATARPEFKLTQVRRRVEGEIVHSHYIVWHHGRIVGQAHSLAGAKRIALNIAKEPQ